MKTPEELSEEIRMSEHYTCDRCGWKTKKYSGQGECYNCFEGLMIKKLGLDNLGVDKK